MPPKLARVEEVTIKVLISVPHTDEDWGVQIDRMRQYGDVGDFRTMPAMDGTWSLIVELPVKGLDVKARDINTMSKIVNSINRQIGAIE